MKKKIRIETEWDFFYYALQFKVGIYPSLLAYAMIAIVVLTIYGLLTSEGL